MYEIAIYPITEDLWRWEIRCAGSLLRCGTTRSNAAAERDAREVAIGAKLSS